jgi:hypothetical protein
MPKGWLCDKGGSGNEGMGKAQRHVCRKLA